MDHSENRISTLSFMLSSEDTLGSSVDELKYALEATQNNVRVIKQRLKTLIPEQKHNDILGESAIITDDSLLCQVAWTIPAQHLNRFAFEFLHLSPTEITNASGVLVPTVYDKVTGGLHWWAEQKSKHNVGRLKKKLVRAIKNGYVKQEVLEKLESCKCRDPLSNTHISAIADFFTSSSWEMFSSCVLKLPRSLSLFDAADGGASIHKQALGILRLWRDKLPIKTVQDLQDVVKRANVAGILSRHSLELVDDRSESSVTTATESDVSSQIDKHSLVLNEVFSKSERNDETDIGIITKTEQWISKQREGTACDETCKFIEQLTHNTSGKQLVMRNRYLQLCTLNQQSWRKASDLPVWWNEMTALCGVVGEGVVCVGANDPHDGNQAVVINTYTSELTCLPTLPTAVRGVGVGSGDGMLFVVGGRTYNECNRWVYLPTAYCLSLNDVDGQWFPMQPLIEPLARPIVGYIEGRLYIVGGFVCYDKTNTLFQRTVQIYDSPTDTCRLGAPAPAPCSHSGNGGCVYRNMIIVFTITLCMIYDTHRDTWSSHAHNIPDMYYVKSICWDDQVYVCVWDIHKHTHVLYSYNVETHTCELSAVDITEMGLLFDLFVV